LFEGQDCVKKENLEKDRKIDRVINFMYAVLNHLDHY